MSGNTMASRFSIWVGGVTHMSNGPWPRPLDIDSASRTTPSVSSVPANSSSSRDRSWSTAVNIARRFPPSTSSTATVFESPYLCSRSTSDTLYCIEPHVPGCVRVRYSAITSGQFGAARLDGVLAHGRPDVVRYSDTALLERPCDGLERQRRQHRAERALSREELPVQVLKDHLRALQHSAEKRVPGQDLTGHPDVQIGALDRELLVCHQPVLVRLRRYLGAGESQRMYCRGNRGPFTKQLDRLPQGDDEVIHLRVGRREYQVHVGRDVRLQQRVDRVVYVCLLYT